VPLPGGDGNAPRWGHAACCSAASAESRFDSIVVGAASREAPGVDPGAGKSSRFGWNGSAKSGP
jgi:hypothetical protein